VPEIFAFAALFAADEHHLLYLSKTPCLLALGWVSLALRGLRWRDLGWSLPLHWKRLVLVGVAAGMAMEALELFATQPLLARLTGTYPDLSTFQSVVGNVQLLLLMVAGSWTLAAVGEELVWRGYAFNRAADLFGRTTPGWTLSLVAVSVVFGLAHSYQGLTGVVENTLDGLLLGGLYLASGRNLIVPVLAHGMSDMLDSLSIFSGHYPGLP